MGLALYCFCKNETVFYFSFLSIKVVNTSFLPKQNQCAPESLGEIKLELKSNAVVEGCRKGGGEGGGGGRGACSEWMNEWMKK